MVETESSETLCLWSGPNYDGDPLEVAEKAIKSREIIGHTKGFDHLAIEFFGELERLNGKYFLPTPVKKK